MKAMVFAAGFGTRMGELSKTTPKCLVEVGGKTMLEHVIERLKSFGVGEVVINLHHLADKVREFVESRNRFRITIHFSHENEILGTGGGLKAARKFFDGDEAFFVHNADIYSEIDLGKLLEYHREKKPVATLAVMTRETTRPLLFDSANRLIGWQSKENSSGEMLQSAGSVIPRAFTGIQVVSDRIFHHMQNEQGQFSTIRAFLNAAREGESVLAYDVGAQFWLDMGTIAKLEELKSRFDK